MDSQLAILIMMNNYFHDVATALLLSSAVATWVLVKLLSSGHSSESVQLVVAIYRRMTWLGRLALVWIILGGIPRVVFYEEMEWLVAAGRGQIAALVVKHIFFIILVGGGAALWVKVGRRVRALQDGPRKPPAS